MKNRPHDSRTRTALALFSGVSLGSVTIFFGGVTANASDGIDQLNNQVAAVEVATGTIPLIPEGDAIVQVESSTTPHNLLVASPDGSALEISIQDDSITDSTSTSSSSNAVTTSVDTKTGAHGYVVHQSQSTPGSIYSIIDSAEAQTTFKYSITVDGEPANLTQAADGTIEVAGRDGKVRNVILPAWAVDAGGSNVNTEYFVQGSVLTQVVHLSGDELFPVVADPAVACDFLFCTLEFNKAETSQIAANGTGAAAIAIGCSYTGGFAPLCIASVTAASSVVQNTATNAKNQGRCLGLRAFIYTPGIPAVPVVYSGGNCV